MNAQHKQEGTPASRSDRRLKRPPMEDIDWIPKKVVEEIDRFPWRLKQTGESGDVLASPEYLDRVDDVQAARVFGEWSPETDLSIDAKRSLEHLNYGFKQLELQIIDAKGDLGLSIDELKKLPIIVGMYLPDYKAYIADKFKDRREFRYIMYHIELLFDELRRGLKTVLSQPEVFVEKTEPEPWVDPVVAHTKKLQSVEYFVQLARHAAGAFAERDPRKLENMPLPDETTLVTSLPMPLPDESTRVSLPPPQEQPLPTSIIPELTFQQVLWQAPRADEAPQAGRTRTDMMRDELITQGLVDANDTLKPIVIVAMKNIRDAVNDSHNQKNPYEMVGDMKPDHEIDDEDLRKLTLFTDKLLRQRK